MGNSPSSSAPINDGAPPTQGNSENSSTSSLNTSTSPSTSRRQSVYTLAASTAATPITSNNHLNGSVPSNPVPVASSPPRRRASMKDSPGQSPRGSRRISTGFSLQMFSGDKGGNEVPRSPRQRSGTQSSRYPIVKTPLDENGPAGSPFGKPEDKSGLGITQDVVASPDPPSVVGPKLTEKKTVDAVDTTKLGPNGPSSAGSSSRPPSMYGDKSVKNSSRIVHAYGIGGIAPLAPLAQKKVDDKSSAIPVMISWNGGGRTVYITGSFNNWKQKIRLTKSKADFTTVIDMPGNQTHRFKFIVDDEWKCSEDLPMASDPDGNLVNYLEVQDERGEKMGDGLDVLAKDIEELSISGSESPISSYTSKIPGYLNWHLQPPPSLSPQLSHLPRPEPPPLPQEYPPHLPPHMERVLLNTANSAPSSQTNIGARDDNNELPNPSSVTLNHLYACSIRDGVMALACTSRYRNKYITTVLYKPVYS